MTSHTYFQLASDGWISVKAALDADVSPPVTFTFDVSTGYKLLKKKC
jgi:hypothetical protein